MTTAYARPEQATQQARRGRAGIALLSPASPASSRRSTTRQTRSACSVRKECQRACSEIGETTSRTLLAALSPSSSSPLMTGSS